MDYKKLKTIDTAVILAGGRGTRLSEQTGSVPKPLIMVGEKPILVHIMRRLAVHGVKRFYILGGYLVDKIYQYFLVNSVVSNSLQFTGAGATGFIFNDDILSNCEINIVDTGENAQTAERIKYIENEIKDNFILTYGDTYSDVDVTDIESKLTGNRVLSLCAIPYSDRFGLVKITDGESVSEFKEKSESKEYFINGGFICATPEIFKIIQVAHKDFSKDTMESEELKGRIGAYIYKGYWKAVDTQRDWEEINKDYRTKNCFI